MALAPASRRESLLGRCSLRIGRAKHAVSLSHGLYPWFELEPGRKLTLPPGLPFWYTAIMGKSIKVHQKKLGRPATGRDPAVTARMPQSIIDQIERWAQSQGATRSEAIRLLVEIALKAKK
jgi:hypothetical protein